MKNCQFGKTTGSGNDIADENWAGFSGIWLSGSNNSIHDNAFYHSAIEDENANGFYANPIRILNVNGQTMVYNNTIYHNGGDAITVAQNYTSSGDTIQIFNNTISYSGSAGVAPWKTRAGDGIGGVGSIYNNDIGFCDRLAGDVGGNGITVEGIHLDDGPFTGESDPPEAGKPFIKWLVYKNKVHDCASPANRNTADGGGIITDYNAHNAQIYDNLIYNNQGPGAYSV